MRTLTPIHDFLEQYANSGTVRCHMPGHKGRPLFDITEISGADSLYESSGIIAQSEDIAARLFGSEKTLYSCGGSTLAIQTMLALVKHSGKDEVIAARGSHRSFISGCIHCGLTPVWVYPKDYMSAEVSPLAIEEKFSSRTAAVFINSIDYYGGRSDIPAIARVCEKHGVPLLADNAHGAYLKFTRAADHPITQGASMCADSAHKTLSVLTGGAYLHIADKRFLQSAKEMMSAFGSSSPSYLILDSLDCFNGFISENPDAVITLCDKLSALKKELISAGIPVRRSDEMRLTLDCIAVGSTGTACANELRRRGIECEYADERCCVLLFGIGTSDEDIKKVKNALISGGCFPLEKPEMLPEFIRAEYVMPPGEAFYSPLAQNIPIDKAEGKICAELWSPCPPGVPVIMPGERINKAACRMLKADRKTYIRVF